MKTLNHCLALLLIIPLGVAHAQAPHSDIVRLDPRLDQIVSANAQVQTLTGDIFGISEGPVWIPQGPSGYLLFSDLAANVIYKWTSDNQVSVYLKDSGYTGDLLKVSMEGYLARSGPLFIFNFGS